MIKENRPGYKHTPLGWIPEEWEIRDIGSVCDIYVGRDLKRDNYSPNKTEEYRFPVYSNTVEEEGLYGFYNIEEYKGESLTIVGRGVSLGSAFTRIGSYGAIGRLLVLFPKNGTHAHYITEYINCRLRIHKESSGIPQLTGEQIANYTIVLPNENEQYSIASILSTWDHAITKTQQLIVQLQQRNKGLMQQLLHDKYNEVHLPLCELLKENSFVVKEKASELEVLSVTKNGLISQKEYFKKEVASDDRSKYKIVEKGDIVMSGLNFWMGSIDMVSDQAGIVSPAYKVFKVNSEFISTRFFKHFVRSAQMLKILISCSIIGASIVRRNFDREMFDNWLLKLPSLKEQEQIADVLDSAKTELILLEQKLFALQQQKKGLMQKLLTGEVRVN